MSKKILLGITVVILASVLLVAPTVLVIGYRSFGLQPAVSPPPEKPKTGTLPAYEEKVLYVDSELTDCLSLFFSIPTKCYLVQEEDETKWRSMDSEIRGFTYIPGFRYKLLVSYKEIIESPQDSLPFKITLLEVLEKKLVSRNNYQ